MPNIINPGTENFDYADTNIPKDLYMGRYPENQDFSPNSPMHAKLVSLILRKAKASHNAMEKKYGMFETLDKSMTAFVDMKSSDPDKPNVDTADNEVKIVIPLSFATVESLLTYFTGVFLEYPYFRYRPKEPGDFKKAILLEQLVQYQSMMGRMGLNLHTQFRDGFLYGFGVSAPIWTVKKAYRTKRTLVQQYMNLIRRFVNADERRETVPIIQYEGNELINIDPYLCLPDPSVPIHEIQRGESFGWLERSTYTEMLEEERDDDSVFNVRYLAKESDLRCKFLVNGDRRQGRYGSGDNRNTDEFRPLDNICMYLKIVPKDYGLGDGIYPEKWFFKLSADRVITTAKPLGLDHNMYPASVFAPTYDGYSMTPTSLLEVIAPIQAGLDWFISTHMTAVAKAINDRIIVDPLLINMNDLKDPKQHIIRTRKSLWGRGVKEAAMQLAVTDVTRGHVADAQMFMSMIQNLTGTMVNQSVRRKTSERVSATEAQGDISAFVGRMGKMAKIADMQNIPELAYMIASHTIQLMSQSTFVNITGRFQQQLEQIYGKNGAEVTPRDISIDFDIDFVERSSPGSENVRAMVEAMNIIFTQPLLAQQFDTTRIFMAVARASGFKNVQDFLAQNNNISVSTQTPDQIEEGERKGDLVNIEELNPNG